MVRDLPKANRGARSGGRKARAVPGGGSGRGLSPQVRGIGAQEGVARAHSRPMLARFLPDLRREGPRPSRVSRVSPPRAGGVLSPRGPPGPPPPLSHSISLEQEKRGKRGTPGGGPGDGEESTISDSVGGRVVGGSEGVWRLPFPARPVPSMASTPDLGGRALVLARTLPGVTAVIVP